MQPINQSVRHAYLIKLLIVAVLAVVAVNVAASAAHAQDAIANVPLSERIPAKGHAQEGFTQIVSVTDVPASLNGGTCTVQVIGANNDSVHPNSNIIVTSENSVTIPDVERSPGAQTIPADGPLTLASAVTVSVELGPDGIFSGGTLVVAFDCTEPPPPPTTTPTTAPPSVTCVLPNGHQTTTNPENGNVCTTTTAPPATTPPSTPPGTLPHTGSTSVPLALGAFAALLAGTLLVAALRRDATRTN